MSDYKLVPIEPTAEMIRAYEEASSWTAPFQQQGYKAMLAAAPAVQGEPVAFQIREKGSDNWHPISGSHYQYINDRPHDWGHAEVRALYAAPQSAPDVLGLVEALETTAEKLKLVMETSQYIQHTIDKSLAPAREALAAHRKQGGEV